MKTLAIDTSTKTQALSLTEGGRVLARRLSVVRTNHSESLLANIDDMLRQAEWRVGDLDLVGIGLGPGTFTGLRVGLATAKAIARSSDAALVGISSLAATARPVSALFDGTIYAVCDARRGEVYVAAYRASASVFAEYRHASAQTPAALAAEIEATTGPVAIVGNGLRAFDSLQTWTRPDVTVMGPAWDAPSSVSIALLAAAELADSGPADLAALEPDYVRPSDAEANLARRK